MPDQLIADPQTLTFDEPVRELNVRIVAGTVNVVGTQESVTRLEVSEIEGPPLAVTLAGGKLTVAYEDLPWQGFLKWFDRKGWHRKAVVSLSVPVGTAVEVGVVSADAFVSGISGRTSVRGVSGDTTLTGVDGEVHADTVSGRVEAQALGGDLRYNSVSGGLTLIDAAGSAVKADTVSADVVIDLAPAAGDADVRITTVSGDVAVRLPETADIEVNSQTTSGAVSCAFPELNVSGQWANKSISGRIGQGKGRLKASTVSGALALLRRPARDDDSPEDAAPTDKKVL